MERWLDLLTADGYMKVEYGYCMLPDGTGCIATYMRIPENVDVKKMFWYLNWLNIHPKSQPAGTGSLRYKIWNPADHRDHYFANWEDAFEGVHTTESLDLGEGDRKYDTIRHSFSLWMKIRRLCCWCTAARIRSCRWSSPSGFTKRSYNGAAGGAPSCTSRRECSITETPGIWSPG